MEPVDWIGSSLEDLREFPAQAKRNIGYALDKAQRGGKHADAKPLRGFGDASVLEVVENYDGETYRAVYTVALCRGNLCAALFPEEINTWHQDHAARP